jgi:electron transfer flavoprotein beta subunit
MRIAVCWKWVAVDGDRVSTAVPDRRWAGVSPADRAALEIGLRIAGHDGWVTVISMGPPEAERCLREALAAGADEAVRIDAATRHESRVVAAALANAAADADLILAGDHSLDRGSGAVPGFIAAELRYAQALGLVHVDIPDDISGDIRDSEATPGDGNDDRTTIRAVRRLDGGRRELLDVPLPAVLSVEGAAAQLRRAPLAAVMSSPTSGVQVIPHPPGAVSEVPPGIPPNVEVRPYRPRPRQIHTPSGATLTRVRDLLHIGADSTGVETVELEPPAAAARIIEQLRAWGYIERAD